MYNSNGLCKMHYERKRRTGKVETTRFDYKSKILSRHIPIPESGCWIWEGTTNSQGYGSITIKGKEKKAHRVSWELFNGPIPKGLLVLHKCDTPACINPHHLFLGTHRDNIQDCIKKGRFKGKEYLVKRQKGGKYISQNSNGGTQ
jgi:hypothetical protein